MEDFTEILAREGKTADSKETPVFKKPVIIGKRPGGKAAASNATAKNSNESNPADTPVEQPKLTEKEKSADIPPPQVSKKSPAEVEREKAIPLPYKEPQWSGVCEEQYSLEILKSGVIVDNIKLSTKPFYVFGRLSTCDVTLEHPSISRYHVILQHRSLPENGEEKGWYLYDLGSTHGTFLNKQQVTPKTYCRIRAGHVFKLGASTRLLILQGPPEDEEPESELTVTQLKELRKMREAVMNEMDSDEEEEAKKSATKPETQSESDGIDWGMGEDATDENPQGENPFAVEIEGGLNEDLYLEDPKKTLRGWFDREGYDLEYKVEERGYANFVCRIDLPIETTTGAPIVAEASVKGGKKKEAVVQCALEACRILDRHGLLRQSTHESKRQRKKRYEEDDYYSSDEDTFLDRTGSIERKRQARMKAAGKSADSIETFETLSTKYKAVEKELEQVRHSLAEASAAASTSGADVDDLDSYMMSLQAEASGKKKDTSKLKLRLSELSREEVRLRRLINLTKPAQMPELLPPATDSPTETPKMKTKEAKKNVAETQEVQKMTVTPEAESSASKATKMPEETLKSSAKVPVVKQETEKRPAKKSSALGPLLPPELLKQLQKENEEQESEKAEPKAKAQTKPKEKKEQVEVGDEEDEEEREKSGLVIRKRKKKQAAQSSDTIKKPAPDVRVEYDAGDTSKYAMWIPPEDQTGDGKTSLNKKLGY